VVVGIGLNVTNRQPTTCLQAILEEQLLAAAPQPPSDIQGGVGGDQNRTQEGLAQVQPRGSAAGSNTQEVAQVPAVPQIQREVLLARIITRLDEAFEVSSSCPEATCVVMGMLLKRCSELALLLWRVPALAGEPPSLPLLAMRV
jgi:hypothetical protein